MLIKRAAVIGAGTMGAGIATHLANAGVECALLDIVPKDADASDQKARSKLALDALVRARKARPAAFMNAADASLVTAGNIEDDLGLVAECDWVIEAVTENLEIKRDLYRKIAAHRRPGTIVSSNTSGLALSMLTEGLDEEFRQHFLITHFFNPPRYMYLLELVRGADTLPAVYETLSEFAEKRLGKGVVECKDTPNFIANRIGVFCMGASCSFLKDSGLSIEQADAVTGPVIGRPKTATFRLHDLVGNDVAVLVMENVHRLVPDDESRDLFEPPEWLRRMVEEGKLGRKSGEGFYKKVGKDILVLDLETFEYRPQEPIAFASLDAAKKARGLTEKLRALVAGDDAGARYVWQTLSSTLAYAARRIPEISDDLTSVDRAMRWGFNWELGPFELWDALGVRAVADRLRSEGSDVPQLVEDLLASGRESFYEWEGEGEMRRQQVYCPAEDAMEDVPEREGVISLPTILERGQPLEANRAARLVDIGEGVLCVEFTSKGNTINGDTLDLIRRAIDRVESGPEVGLVIGNQSTNFSLGANLVELSEASKSGNWDAIDAMIRNFHETALRIRYSAKPVVACVQGMALGGGCEIPLACDRIQAAAETYMGLVELGVGLIPAGGGTREMACRAAESIHPGVSGDPHSVLAHYFENIAMARTSTSGADLLQLGYLRDVDGVSTNRDRALADARTRVLGLAARGYCPPRRRDAVRVVGKPGYAELQVYLHQFREGQFISEYDAFLATKLAYVLSGGAVDAEFTVTEQHLLDLEREVFLQLLGEAKTLERIAHTLKTGKPLRN